MFMLLGIFNDGCVQLVNGKVLWREEEQIILNTSVSKSRIYRKIRFCNKLLKFQGLEIKMYVTTEQCSGQFSLFDSLPSRRWVKSSFYLFGRKNCRIYLYSGKTKPKISDYQ